MEKVKFTVQVLVLALAFPVWFFAELTMGDKTVKNVEVNNHESTKVKKAAAVKNEKVAEDLDLETARVYKLIILSN